jgi:adhesin/invasin
MVAPTTMRSSRRFVRLRLKKSPWKVYVLLTLMLISTVSSVRAGDLKNTGAINNTGQVRLKNAATGLPAANGGVYEFFGANQTIPGRQYVDLKLSGTGTKTADADGTVSGTLLVASGVTYDTGPFTTHLTGSVNEQGYVLGTMDKTLPLLGGSGSSTFGSIGTTISWSGVAPGNTLVVRKTGVAVTSVATGKSSIKRYYDIAPATSTGLNAGLVFQYADAELNGQNAATLSLWRSTDGGSTWRNQAGVVDVAQRTITKTAIQTFGRMTASDASNPLGSTQPEWVAQNIASTLGNGQKGTLGAILQPLVVTVRDFYGNPIPGSTVTFSILSVPGTATGQNLTVSTATTGSTGQASTVLTLGSQVGDYIVTATSAGLSGSPVMFTATASVLSVASTLAMASGNNQTGVVTSTLGAPFVVTVADQFGAPKSGVPVQFALSGAPAGATGQQLTNTTAATDVNGQASTTLKLGTKSGNYFVNATSGSLSGSPVAFIAKAVSGAASVVSLPGGSSVSGQAGTALGGPLVVLVTDSLGNPVSGVSVRFTLSSSPAGATGQSPTDLTVVTDNSGRASMVFTVGTKVGVYTFDVSVGSLPAQVITVNATAGTSATLAMVLGDNQSAALGKALSAPLVVMVTDAYGNPVSGAGVSFAITSFPSGSTGQSLSMANVSTNVQGQASTVLTLGNKPGTYSVAASSGSLSGSPVTFTATATGAAVASRLVQTSGVGQSGTVSTQLASPFVVTVLDQYGNPFAGATVRFAITGSPSGENAAVLSSSSVLTSTNGQASVRLTLGKTVGVYTVTASSDTLSGSPVQFTAVATGGQTGTVASRLVQTSGSGQTGVVTAQLASPFVVTAVDTAGNPVPGVSVHFALGTVPSGSSGQVLSIADVATDANGKAQTVLTLGTKAGQYTVTASSGTLIGSPVTFAATASSGIAARLLYVTGNGQTGPTYSSLAQPFVVRVTDADLNPVSGASVRFAVVESPVSSSGFSLDATETLTDALGLASTRLTFGDRAGLYTIRAGSLAIVGAEVAFTANATSGSPLTLNLVSGDAQRGLVGSTLRQPFVVAAFDADGNPVRGVEVQFAIDSAPAGAIGHSISRTTAVTDSLGNASTFLTLGNVTGVYTVAPSSNGLNGGHPVFHGLATLASGAMSIAYASGDAQSAAVLSQLSSPLVATVLGADGTPVTGQVVTFAIDSLPSGATGQVLSAT